MRCGATFEDGLPAQLPSVPVAPAPPAAPVPARFCTRCGAPREPGTRFCSRCGAQFDAVPAAVTDRAAELAAEQAPPVRYSVAAELPYTPLPSRAGSIARLPLALPHIVVWLALLMLSLVTTPLAWLAALLTGRQPDGLRRLHAAMLRHATRTAAYLALATDVAPSWPWSGGEGHPIAIEVPGGVRLGRLRTLLIVPLALPAVMTAILFGIVTWMLAVGAWAVILVTGRLPRTIHEMQELAIRFQCRTLAHVPLLLMPEYPWYERGPVVLPGRRG
jgi:uncharacterized protein DUF4389/zinc ribbon protein